MRKLNKKDYLLLKAHFDGIFVYKFKGYNEKGNGVYELEKFNRELQLDLKNGYLYNHQGLFAYNLNDYCNLKDPSNAWCLTEKEMPQIFIVEYNHS